MKAIDRSIIRIRAEDVQAAALWTLSVVKCKHVVALQEASKEADSTVFEDEVVVEKITLSELEKIRESAY